MSNPFKNRVYGCAIIKSINSNYNADFSHQPRTLPDGVVYATDKALKWAIRNYWDNFYGQEKGDKTEKIFFRKSLNERLQPRTLDERYISLFGSHKTNITADKFSVFKYDGENIEGVLPTKPKPAHIKFFKDLPEEDEIKGLEDIFKKIAGKKSKELKIFDIEKSKLPLVEDNVNLYFFIEEDKINIVERDENLILEAVSTVLDNMGGGINRHETLRELFGCLDIRLFGATYAGVVNLSIHGSCQISHSKDQFNRSSHFTEQIMSPFRNKSAKSEDSFQTTLGSQSRLAEGHYVHHFSVNPKNIEADVERVKADALSDMDIEKLKEGLRKGVSYYDSAAKIGTDNECLLWVQLKVGSKAIMPSFVELVTINEKKEIDLAEVTKMLAKHTDDIEKIELYYNNVNTVVINKPVGAVELGI